MGKILNIDFSESSQDVTKLENNIILMLGILSDGIKDKDNMASFVQNNISSGIDCLREVHNYLPYLNNKDLQLSLFIKNASFYTLNRMSDCLEQDNGMYELAVYYASILAGNFVSVIDEVLNVSESGKIDYNETMENYKKDMVELYKGIKQFYYYYKLWDIMINRYSISEESKLPMKQKDFFEKLIRDTICAFFNFNDDTYIKYFNKVLNICDEYNAIDNFIPDYSDQLVYSRANQYKIYYLTVRNIDDFILFFEDKKYVQDIKDKLLKLKKSIRLDNKRNNDISMLISILSKKINEMINNMGYVDDIPDSFFDNSLEYKSIIDYIDYLFLFLSGNKKENNGDIVWGKIRKNNIKDRMLYMKDNKTFLKCSLNEKYDKIFLELIDLEASSYTDHVVDELKLLSYVNSMQFLLKSGMTLEENASKMNLQYILDEVSNNDYKDRDNDNYIIEMSLVLEQLNIDDGLEKYFDNAKFIPSIVILSNGTNSVSLYSDDNKTLIMSENTFSFISNNSIKARKDIDDYSEFSNREYTINRIYDYIKSKHNMLKKELSKEKKR